jgi:hypothetical protein
MAIAVRSAAETGRPTITAAAAAHRASNQEMTAIDAGWNLL